MLGLDDRARRSLGDCLGDEIWFKFWRAHFVVITAYETVITDYHTIRVFESVITVFQRM